jgi:hypothetical protein
MMDKLMLQAAEEELLVDHDEKVLLSLGYKQEFKREFSLWSTFCVSFAVLGLLPSFASTLYYGMGYAGTAGVLSFFLLQTLSSTVGAEYSTDLNLYSRYGLGMDNCYGLYPMCRPESG